MNNMETNENTSNASPCCMKLALTAASPTLAQCPFVVKYYCSVVVVSLSPKLKLTLTMC